MLSPNVLTETLFTSAFVEKLSSVKATLWIKSSLFPLFAGGDEEYIYMNKVTVHKQQGDQEKQDKGRELKINGFIVSDGMIKAHKVRALLWQL